MPYADPEAKRANQQKYYYAKREHLVSRSKAWADANPERFREHQRRSALKRKYGMTLESYAELLVSQGGVCAICETDDTSPWDWFCVDHCHTTDVVRGLLCQACNNCIGQARDSAEILRKAIRYLEAVPT